VKEEREKARQRIDAAWPALGSGDRLVLSQYYFRSSDFRETAAAAIADTDRKRKLFRARQRLRAALASTQEAARRR
jgi:hypothetical protein